MSGGLIDVTLVSASIAPYSSFDSEPRTIYAVLKCARGHQRTNNAEDQGRLPVWNESFSFEIQQEDMSSELLIQVFNVNSEADELLGIGRIPILDMVGKEEATLCALINPVQGEVGKLKAAWKWTPGSQMRRTSKSNEGDSASAAYSYASKPSMNTSDDRLGKLEVSDALAKLSMERDSGKFSAWYPDDTGKFGKEQKVEHYSYPPPPEGHPAAHAPTSETESGFDYAYPPRSSDVYPPEKDTFHPHYISSYPPQADAYPPSNQGYQQAAYPPSNQGYPPPFPGSVRPPPPSTAYPPDSTAYPPVAAPYPPRKESQHDSYSNPHLPSEGFAYTEWEGGDTEKGSSGKDKGKTHGSHTSYGQPPPSGYSAHSYHLAPEGRPPFEHPPGGFPPAQHGYSQAPGGYPPGQHSYPPAPHGYSPAPHGYAPSSHGYPPASQGFPPASYPPQYPPVHAGEGYLPQGYPASGHGSGHKPGKQKGDHKADKHGYAAGSYAGHTSSGAKPSSKHKEAKQSSSHKHGKAKKEKSFKGKEFKKFKF